MTIDELKVQFALHGITQESDEAEDNIARFDPGPTHLFMLLFYIDHSGDVVWCNTGRSIEFIERMQIEFHFLRELPSLA